MQSINSMTIAIAWCLAWGEGGEPQFDLSVLQQMRDALNHGGEVPEKVESFVKEAKQLDTKDGNLYLRHYGEHDYVNNNP